jgi:small-conductance mechanosensitive channel
VPVANKINLNSALRLKDKVSPLEFIDILAQYPYLITIIWVVVIASAATVLERLGTRWLRRVIKRTEMPPHVGNGLVLTGRIIILLGAIVALLHVGGVPPDLLVSLSALGGAAIGFASQRTIGNFIAGLFLLVTHPFRVGDYVRIDGVEGIVQEVTLNYAKILTQTETVTLISTLRILDRDVTNFRFKGEDAKARQYRYGIPFGFDLSVSIERIHELLNSVIEHYAEKMPKRAEYQQIRLNEFSRQYMFYIYVKNPRDIFVLQPQIVEEVTKAYDDLKQPKR